MKFTDVHPHFKRFWLVKQPTTSCLKSPTPICLLTTQLSWRYIIVLEIWRRSIDYKSTSRDHSRLPFI